MNTEVPKCEICGQEMKELPDLYDDGTESRTWSLRCPYRCHEKEAKQMSNEIEIDWGCIGEYDEESGVVPEWDNDGDVWECHSCDNGPCYQ